MVTEVLGTHLIKDVLEEKVDLSLPNQYMEALQKIHERSKYFPECVFDLRITTYELIENECRLYISWEVDSVFKSTFSKYISYDPIKCDFFDWNRISFDPDARYNEPELVNLFGKQFHEGSKNRELYYKFHPEDKK